MKRAIITRADMLLDPQLLFAYIPFAIALALSPGPDTLFVIATALQYRAKAAVFSALGIATGGAVFALAVAAGLAGLLALFPFLFDVMRIVGALFLLWLGIQAARAVFQNNEITLQTSNSVNPNPKVLFARGFVTTISNPKIIVFYSGMLPQFVNPEMGPETGNVGMQIFLLALIHIAFGLSFLCLVALGAAKASVWLTRGNGERWLNGISSLVFFALAGNMALLERD